MSRDITSGHKATAETASGTVPEWLKVVQAQVESMKFGTVQITVHDSKVVQIERIEKTRLDRPR